MKLLIYWYNLHTFENCKNGVISVTFAAKNALLDNSNLSDNINHDLSDKVNHDLSGKVNHDLSDIVNHDLSDKLIMTYLTG